MQSLPRDRVARVSELSAMSGALASNGRIAPKDTGGLGVRCPDEVAGRLDQVQRYFDRVRADAGRQNVIGAHRRTFILCD